MPPSIIETLERKYGGHVRRVGSLSLLPAEQALRLLDDIRDFERDGARSLRFSVEAFRLLEGGGIQPAMAYSDPTPEARVQHGGVLAATRALVAEGAANGYPWYEVYVEDLATRECLGFDSHTAA